jgi:hypothetical protein
MKVPQVAPAATQRSPKQQPSVQVEPAQQGCGLGLGAPQATGAPLLQTIPLPLTACPEATQLVPSQHPPPEHFIPGQHGKPAAPHWAQAPALQVAPFWHMVPSAMHCPVPLSQQPAVQALLAQQGSPTPPQARHTSPPQAVPAAVQARPAQQICPAAPHC